MKAAPTKVTLNFHCPKTLEDMNVVQGEYYCSSCSRMMVDFTLMSDSQIQETISKLAGTKACGAFRSENIQLTQKQKVVHLFRQVAAFTIALFSVKAAYARGADKSFPSTHDEKEKVATSNDEILASNQGRFYGKVIDNKNYQAIRDVDVSLLNADGDVIQETTTDDNGSYVLTFDSDSTSTGLTIVVDDYRQQTISVPVTLDQRKMIDIVLQDQLTLSGDLLSDGLNFVALKEKKTLFPRVNVRRYHPVVCGSF